MNTKRNRKTLIIVLCSIGVLLIGIGIYLVVTKSNYREIVNNVFNVDIPFLDSSTDKTEEEEVLPSDLKGMVKSSTPFENWDKYTNTQYIDIVKDLNYDSSPLLELKPESGLVLVYVYYNSKTKNQISFSAIEKYTEDGLVESIFKAILNDAKTICLADYYMVCAGSRIEDGWAFHSFIPQEHLGALDGPEDFHPVDLISQKSNDNIWTTVIQGTNEYNKMVEIVPDDILEPMAKVSRLNLSQQMNEKGCYNF